MNSKNPYFYRSKNSIYHHFFIAILFGIISNWQSTIFAQNQNLKLDLLQGKWLFRALENKVNFEIHAQTSTYNPWFIHFEISHDTCKMVRLAEIKDHNYRYDTLIFTIQLVDQSMLFFPITKNHLKKPAYQLEIEAIQNQSIRLIDKQAATQEPTLLVRNSSYTFTFSRHDDLYQSGWNSQRELLGKWYVPEDFLNELKESKDTLLLNKKPFYYHSTMELYGAECDSLFHYKTVEIFDETLKINDSLDFKPCHPASNSLVVLTPREPFFSFKDMNIYYSIIPAKKIIEISYPETTNVKDETGLYEIKRTLFRYKYLQKNDQLYFIKTND